MLSLGLKRSDIPPWISVDDEGRVWSTRAKYGRQLDAPRRADEFVNGGYRKVYWDQRPWPAHRVVWAWFHGECPPGNVVIRHLNDDGLDNRPENLAIGAQRDNVNDAFRNGGRSHIGARNPQSKLTEDDVRAIRNALAAGQSSREVALTFDISARHVRGIGQRKDWAHVA